MEGPSESQFERVEEMIKPKSFIDFTSLPPELWSYAAVFANYRDLMNLCLTSKTVREKVCGDNTFWKNKTYHDFEGIYDIVDRSGDWRENYHLHRALFSLGLVENLEKRNFKEAERRLAINRQRGFLDVDVKDTEGRTALMYAMPMSLWAVPEKFARTLLDLGANVDIRNKYGNTALAIASNGNGVRGVRMLLKAGADPNVQNGEDETALMWSGVSGYFGISELLLRFGADPNLQDIGGKTALIWASKFGKIDVVRVLLEYGADINIRDYEAEGTALEWASAKNHKEIANLLLEYGAGGVWQRTSHILRKIAEEYGGI